MNLTEDIWERCFHWF